MRRADIIDAVEALPLADQLVVLAGCILKHQQAADGVCALVRAASCMAGHLGAAQRRQVADEMIYGLADIDIDALAAAHDTTQNVRLL
jgi:hypothetical protein